MKRFLFLLFLCFPVLKVVALELEYGFNGKKETPVPITRLQLFSERSSGSNYINTLIKQNLSINIRNDSYGYYGHKHWPVWLQLPANEYLGPKEYYTFEKSDDTLFVIIFRNPYDWLRSFNKQPFSAARDLWKLPFSEFIRSPWASNEKETIVSSQKKLYPYFDCDPLTKSPFQNVMKLRSAKIETMLMIRDRVKNIYYINYEVVRDHPKQVIEEIARIYGVQRKHPFQNVTTYKGGKNVIYKPKVWPSISKEDVAYINQQLDRELEASINYILAE
jgi:hypothetical protein